MPDRSYGRLVGRRTALRRRVNEDDSTSDERTRRLGQQASTDVLTIQYLCGAMQEFEMCHGTSEKRLSVGDS